MKFGTVLFVLIVAMYAGVEVWAMHKVSYRMEADYIHNILVTAKTVTTACDAVPAGKSASFEKALTSVRARMAREMSAADSAVTDLGIDEQIATLTEASTAAAMARVTELGCEDPAIRTEFRRYGIYAR